MASAAQTTSSCAVVAGSCSRSIRLSTRRRPVSLPFLRSRIYHRCLARPRHQVIHRPLISVVSQVAVDIESNSSVAVSEQEMKAEEESLKESPRTTNNEATISAVVADVTNLIKLIDTRDIVELELKHYDYELSIKKKEALAPPVGTASLLPLQAGQATCLAHAPPLPVAPPAAAAASTPLVPASISVAAPASPPSATLPCILSPMAGTFYERPAPGEPPFVKVGDKVTKGQVICIVEAMKLMNEIEADQSGTIVDVVAEDGKAVSIDTPLFSIKP